MTDKYVVRLKILAKRCKFTDFFDQVLWDQFVNQFAVERIQAKPLGEVDLMLMGTCRMLVQR